MVAPPSAPRAARGALAAAALLLAALALLPGARRGVAASAAALVPGVGGPRLAAAEVEAAAAAVAADAAARCALARGDWCAGFHAAAPEPATAPPRGALPCPGACSGIGVCDAAVGACRCPAGWGGPACAARDPRPCSQLHRRDDALALAPYDEPIDWTKGGLTLRCGGACDDDIAMCFCPADTKYGRVPAEEGAPPGAPPRRRGRPLGMHCQPSSAPGGAASPFGDAPREALFGADGWCNADSAPARDCPCYLDGLHGPTCDVQGEMVCINQCSARGRCDLGFCHCDAGWFGHDCAHRVAGALAAATAPPPWVLENAATPAALDPAERAAAAAAKRAAAAAAAGPPGAGAAAAAGRGGAPAAVRRRPLIYIYEVPPQFTSHLLQYRVAGHSCVHRIYTHENKTAPHEWAYGSEPALHEALAQSEHRTLDPEEADFFYVPVYLACFTWPVYGAADAPSPGGAPAANRAQAAAALLEEAGAWVRARPWWARRGGRDHLIVRVCASRSLFAGQSVAGAALLPTLHPPR
jgi:hypothetical protein